MNRCGLQAVAFVEEEVQKKGQVDISSLRCICLQPLLCASSACKVLLQSSWEDIPPKKALYAV